jgi:hypothetical protein
MPTAHDYGVHGLIVRSPFALRAPRTTGDVDLTIEYGTERVDMSENVVLRHVSGASEAIAFRLAAGGLVLNVGEKWQFHLDRETRRLLIITDDDSGVDRVLAEGMAMALALHERGLPTLHANAVSLDGRLVLFGGASGQGKSTTAALMVGAGAVAVADDLVRLHAADHALVAYPGNRGIRLRSTAVDLIGALGLDALGTETSADHRTIVNDTRHTELGQCPVAAVVLPAPDRIHTEVRVERLAAADALVAVLQATRVVGWLEPAAHRHTFRTAQEIVQRVPILRVHVPWGPPWTLDLARRVRAAIEAHIR